MMISTLHNLHVSLSKRPYVTRLCLLTVLLSGIAGNSLFSMLRARPYPVLSTANWANETPQYPNHRPYHWLANGDIAYLKRGPDGKFQVCYQHMGEHGPSGALRYGPVLPSQAIASRFYPSPDERWVAYDTASPTFQYRAYLISADGKNVRSASPLGETFALWLSDNRSFLTDHPETRDVMVRHLDSPRTATIPDHRSQCGPVVVSSLSIGPQFLIGGSFGISHATDVFMRNSPLMLFRSYCVSQPDVAQQTWMVPVPTEVDEGQAYVSPDQQHVLWITYGWKHPPMIQWLHDRIPWWRNAPRPILNELTFYCFLSDLHGNHRHLILNNLSVGLHGAYPVWTPDSKHLSFIDKGQLFLVAVD